MSQKLEEVKIRQIHWKNNNQSTSEQESMRLFNQVSGNGVCGVDLQRRLPICSVPV